VRIEIWSDVICPWCFLGKRRFEEAVARLPEHVAVDVRWRAYQLDPTATAEPADLRRSMEEKYGPGAFDGMTRRLTELGTAHGIDYRFDRALRVSTRDAHRLSAWVADTSGHVVQGRLVERLFVAYFTEGVNVADHDELVRLATEVGIDGDEAGAVLASDGYDADVAADIAAAQRREITGVPAFVVEDRLLIPGAQEVDTFQQLLVKAAERFRA
jgi:predicted DsbA family dithiol-disulfide isomerase